MTAEPAQTTAPTAPTAATASTAAAEAERIATLRAQIDAIDEGILSLMTERVRLSRDVQAHRIAAGGVRLELGRERRVIDTYRRALGDAGGALGDAVLRSCRGPL